MLPPAAGVDVKVEVPPFPPLPPLPPTAEKAAAPFAPLPPPPPIDWIRTPWAFLLVVPRAALPSKRTETSPPVPPPPEVSPTYWRGWLPPTVPPLPPIDWARIPKDASPPREPAPVEIVPEWVTVTVAAFVADVL